MHEEEEITFVFDESGNLGSRGRYFVIACIETKNAKSLHNIMKKKIFKTKSTFPDIKVNGYEIKASDAYPCVKYHILETIAEKDIKISYIVADKYHVYPELLGDENCFYNYLIGLLTNQIITSKYKGKKIRFIMDNRTIKVKSINSFSEYIKIKLNYCRLLKINLSVEYIDSKSRKGYIVQAADYVANAIYSFYEYNYRLYYDLIKCKNKCYELFPKSKFGTKSKVI
ncbi:MAG TPA: DUF3800 domain-containing protein [Bacillota bacterium]|jgi:ribosomal protein L30/L7E|nr:DUF3800 domain-containing protein [Bacillota bacterium]